MGYWYLLELIGFVCIPLAVFVEGVKSRRINLIRAAAILTAVGIILNRLNVSMIAYRWDAPVRHFPTWMEIVVALSIIFASIWAFRWVVYRMPVLREPPAWAEE